MLAQLGIDLDGAHVGRLVERTEGWVAGLRLAALQLQGGGDPAGFVDAFSGDDHAVAAYLLTEVIDRQPPELLDFLVRVSFVDLVSADLADALTGARTGAATLAELAASNLFVHAVGPGGRWYRLHRLIADVLRTRITDPRTIRDVHRRAAEWHRRHSLPLDAIRYALRGGLWPLAAEILGVHGLALVIRGSARELDMLLSAAPRDALLGQPELAATLAGARIYLGSHREVRELVAAAAAGADDLPQPRAERLRVVLDLVETGHARARGDLVALAAAARRVPDDPRTLSGLGLAGWDVIPLLVLSNAGTAELWTGDVVAAEKHLRAAVDTTQWSGLLRPHLNAASQLALLLAERGDLDAAQAERAGGRPARDRSGLGDIAAGRRRVSRARLGGARPERARRRRPVARAGRRGRGRRTRTARPTRRGHAECASSRRQRRLGGCTHRPAGSDRADRECSGRARRPSGAGRGRAAAPDRRPAASGRRPDQAARTGHAAHRPRPRPAAPRRRRRRRGGAVAGLLPPVLGTVRERVDRGVLRTLIAAEHNRSAALQLLEDPLLVAAPLGMRRPFLVEAAGLQTLLADRIEAGTAVAAFAVDLLRRMSGQHDRPPPASLVEALTEREQVVLRYLASTLSNAEIAAELYLSVNTVKTHQRMVYRKLGADGRRDAVRRAKQLRLL